MNHRNTAALDQWFKPLFEINVLAGADRDGSCRPETLIMLCVHPRREILYPCEVVLFKALGKADVITGHKDNLADESILL